MRMRRDDFDAAMATHGRKVHTLAVYLLADHAEAEDLTQEVLMRLWRKGHEVAPDKIGAWLLRVTRNACIDAIRRRRGVGRIEIDDAGAAYPVAIDLTITGLPPDYQWAITFGISYCQ